jgi:hypothetical protein
MNTTEGEQMGTVKEYTTECAEDGVDVYTGDNRAILTIGRATCKANIHLYPSDCRALAALLLEAAEKIERVAEAA